MLKLCLERLQGVFGELPPFRERDLRFRSHRVEEVASCVWIQPLRGKEVTAERHHLLEDQLGVLRTPQEKARAQNHECRHFRDAASPQDADAGDGGGIVGAFKCQLKEVMRECSHKGMVAADPLGLFGLRVGEREAPGSLESTWQGVSDWLGELGESAQTQNTVGLRLDLCPEPLRGSRDEVVHGLFVAKHSVASSKFLHDDRGIECMLGKDCAALALAFGTFVPDALERLGGIGTEGKMELELTRALEESVDEEFGEPPLILRERDRGAEGTADPVSLFQEDRHDLGVNRVVLTIESNDHDFGPPLAEAVDPSLTLLKAVGVPGQIIVEDCVKVLLEVDSLTQAVGSDKDTLRCLGERGDPVATLLVAQAAGHALDLEVGECLVERPSELCRDVFSGVDEETPDDRVMSCGNKFLDCGEAGLEFGVLRCVLDEPLGLPCQRGEPAAIGISGREELHGGTLEAWSGNLITRTQLRCLERLWLLVFQTVPGEEYLSLGAVIGRELAAGERFDGGLRTGHDAAQERESGPPLEATPAIWKFTAALNELATELEGLPEELPVRR